MVGVTRFAAMGAEQECVEPTLLPPNIERCNVREKVVHPVAVGRVLLGGPFLGGREFPIYPSFHLAFIVDTVKANDSLQKDVEFRVAGGILGNFKQWLEDVTHHFLEVMHQTSSLVHIKETRHLN